MRRTLADAGSHSRPEQDPRPKTQDPRPFMSTATKQIEELANTEYKYGFVTDTEQDIIPVGLNEDVVRLISSKKGEPAWMLEWRLKAFRAWLKMEEPNWQNVTFEKVNYQGVSYYAAPTEKKKLNSLDEVDPE